MKKTWFGLIYGLAVLLGALAAAAFLTGFHGGGKLTEALGLLTAVSMAAEMLLWLCITVVKSKKLPGPAQQTAVRLVKLLRGLHRPVGATAAAALALHYAMASGTPELTALRQYTGFGIGGFVLLTALLGLFGKKLTVRKVHIVTAFAACFCLLAHLLAEK